jgi:hypothetical protein
MSDELATILPATSAPGVQAPAVSVVPVTAAATAPQAAISPATTAPTAAVAARAPVLMRLREVMGSVIPLALYRIARLGALGAAGLVGLLSAAVILFGGLIPGQSALRALDADLAKARLRPPVEMSPEEGLGRFMGSLPTRGQLPVVIGEILQQAGHAGVPLDNGHYSFVAGKAGSASRYELEFPVKASYPRIRDFINRTLTAVPAAGLDKLHIERKSVADETVSADLRFVIFVRSESPR